MVGDIAITSNKIVTYLLSPNHANLVQPFYEILGVNLQLIATQSLLGVSSREKFPLQHTKSPKESFQGKCINFNNFIVKIIILFLLY